MNQVIRMAEEVFTAEHLVIITSQIAIDALQWRKYMSDHWSRLTRRDATILVLAGIHGEDDGAVGEEDAGLLKDYQKQIRVAIERHYFFRNDSNNRRWFP